jgi:hypothetical protein
MPKLHNRRTRSAPREAAEINRELKFPTCHRERRRLGQQRSANYRSSSTRYCRASPRSRTRSSG